MHMEIKVALDWIRNRWKLLLILALVVLLLGSAVWVIWKINQPTPPGGFGAHWKLPKADRSDVGQWVDLSLVELAKEATRIQGGELYFIYVYDPNKEAGRLVVCADGNNLTIYETLWTGGDALCEEVLKKSFPAMIIDRVYEDGNLAGYFMNRVRIEREDNYRPEDIVLIDQYVENQDEKAVRYYYGSIGKVRDEIPDWAVPLENDMYLALVSGNADTENILISSCIERLHITAERFDLWDKLGLEEPK